MVHATINQQSSIASNIPQRAPSRVAANQQPAIASNVPQRAPSSVPTNPDQAAQQEVFTGNYCPGGSLEECINFCPSETYGECTERCADQC